MTSSSIDIDGSGAPGDPWDLTALGTHVCTSATRPTGIQGLVIYETDTSRTLIYDGTNWVIIGGQLPGCKAYTNGASLSIANNTTTTVALSTEVYDIGGFHASTNGFFTVPAGMAGDYDLTAMVRATVSTASGTRVLALELASNGSITEKVPLTTTYPSTTTSNGYVVTATSVRLVAGATVTLRYYQNSGSPETQTEAMLTLNMRRHIPSLT